VRAAAISARRAASSVDDGGCEGWSALAHSPAGRRTAHAGAPGAARGAGCWADGAVHDPRGTPRRTDLQLERRKIPSSGWSCVHIARPPPKWGRLPRRRTQRTPRAPTRAHLPLLPSGPGGVRRDGAARGVCPHPSRDRPSFRNPASAPAGRPRRVAHLTTRRFGVEPLRPLFCWSCLHRRVAGGTKEDSPSGLWRTLGKRVGFTPSGVRIPHPPPAEGPHRTVRAFVVPGPARHLHRYRRAREHRPLRWQP
jgi:hypothetical protein